MAAVLVAWTGLQHLGTYRVRWAWPIAAGYVYLCHRPGAALQLFPSTTTTSFATYLLPSATLRRWALRPKIATRTVSRAYALCPHRMGSRPPTNSPQAATDDRCTLGLPEGDTRPQQSRAGHTIVVRRLGIRRTGGRVEPPRQPPPPRHKAQGQRHVQGYTQPTLYTVPTGEAPGE